MCRSTWVWSLGILGVLVLSACAEDLSPGMPRAVEVEIQDLDGFDHELDGRLGLWIEDGAGEFHWLGTLDPAVAPQPVREIPHRSGARLLISVHSPGQEGIPEAPGSSVLWTGSVPEAGQELRLEFEGGVLQPGREFRERPGQFTIFSPSTGHLGRYPFHEESGVWLFNTQPRVTDQNDTWVRLTPLSPGWIYEHWAVRDLGLPDEIWLSAGKFAPDRFGVVRERDHTGWGPFSGVADYEVAGEEQFPGADWFANPLDLPFPADLELPLDLTEVTPEGQSRWTYVISVEPAFDLVEPLTEERPFPLRPYMTPVGSAGPGMPRPLELSADLPRAFVRGS